MKRLTLTAIALSISAFANADQLDDNGFSGEITGLIGFTAEKSNFNTDEKKKADNELNTSGSSESGITAAPLGQIRYTFDDRNQVFIGTSREDIAVGDFALEAGYTRAIGEHSTLTLSFLPSLGGETWEDPYVVDQDREITDVSSNAFRVNYTNILDSNFSADLAYFTKELEKEASGDASLDRDGSGIYSKFTYHYGINETSMLEPSLIYKSFSADGDAMSNTTYGVELSYKKLTGRHAFAISGNYETTSYDAQHAAFDITQKDHTFGMFGAYEYDHLFGWENVAFNAIAGFDITSSNIAFYESSEIIIGTGITYNF
ncbi:DUF2860 domain-containing protein [Vibrio kasasachensis]|uniref:DUF2860 family protein n=1 Tax=Vibrio kasasachensis TaxID=2910248 RepID=UPI003D107AD5